VTLHATTFEAVRPRLFGIAYRTLESASHADDVVQDTWFRWQGTDRNGVRDAAAFLATTTQRLALNVAQSARVRRETSIDPWGPEPVDVQADPTRGVERREALELAMRLLVEKLSTSERAAYVLAKRSTTRIGRSQTCSRRARPRPGNSPPVPASTSPANARRRVSAAEQQRFIDAFVDAAQTGDLTTRERLLVAHGRPGSGLPASTQPRKTATRSAGQAPSQGIVPSSSCFRIASA
jgi:RNA polymerase sigma-70 factor (ECF subfamily)